MYHLDLKVIGRLEVVGHRLRGLFPLLSREQLEKDLRSDCLVQKARAEQQALLKVSTGAACLCLPGPPGQLSGTSCSPAPCAGGGELSGEELRLRGGASPWKSTVFPTDRVGQSVVRSEGQGLSEEATQDWVDQWSA